MDSFLPIDIFKLPIFNEIKFGVLGFSSEEMINIKQAIESREGKVISNINDISSSQELNLILLKYSEAKTYESFLNTLKIPVLNENWFDICNQRNVFIKPENFLLGHKVPLNQNSNRKEMFHGEMKILSENKMRKYMREVESGDSGYWFLSECVIHFFNVEQDYEKILKNIVNIAGGFYINQFNISVTHLITQNYQEEDLANFKKIGSNIYVLHPLWLKDCFFYKKKISEFEYFLMPGINLQINNNENMVNSVRNPIMAKKNSFNDDSFSLMSMKFQKNKQTIDCQENKYPINIHNNEKLQRNKTASPFKKEHIEIKSFLFKNLYFFMNTSDFKEMRTYRYKILENSGKFIDNIKNNKFPIFYVLSDGLSSLKIKAQKLENVNYVSFRWVDYCLEKKQIVKNHMDLKLIHLSPLTYKMPLVCFKNSMMYVSGFPTQEKIILKNLMKVMGITLVYEK